MSRFLFLDAPIYSKELVKESIVAGGSNSEICILNNSYVKILSINLVELMPEAIDFAIKALAISHNCNEFILLLRSGDLAELKTQYFLVTQGISASRRSLHSKLS
jgi:hypothetical protein